MKPGMRDDDEMHDYHDKDEKQTVVTTVAADQRGLGVVVLHPGSWEVRIGMAWDRQPKVVKHVVAKRIMKFDAAKGGGKRPAMNTPQSNLPAAWKKEDPAREAEAVSAHRNLKNHTKKGSVEEAPTKKIRYNETVSSVLKAPNYFEFKNADFSTNPEWSPVDLSPMYLFGDEALNISPEEPYEVIFPIQRGEFNKSLSLATICELFNQHWTDAIQKHLGIPQRAFKDYAVALVVQDTMNKNQVTEIIHVLLRRMRFRAIFVIQESVAAAYGSGTQTACVVDVGHQTTSVCCVEEGMSLPETRLHFPVGSDDINHLLHWLLGRVDCNSYTPAALNPADNGFSTTPEDNTLRNPQLASTMTRIKEELCHFPFGGDKNAANKMECTFPVQHHPNGALKYFTMVQDEIHALAAMALFHPPMMHEVVGCVPPPVELPEDFTPISMTVIPAAQPNAEHTAVDMASIKQPESRFCLPMPLDEAVMVSIGKSGLNKEGRTEHQAELKRKLFINIVLAGGGALIRGLTGALEERVMEQLMKTNESVHDIEVLPWQPDTPPNFLAWKGASVAATTDASREMYIQQNECFEVGGVQKYLRDRATFYW